MFHSQRYWIALLLPAILHASAGWASEPASGWRGNGTGLWPGAQPPIEWYRIPRGALDGLRADANRPSEPGPGKSPSPSPLVVKGLLRDWLVLGPFAVADSVKDFDKEFVKADIEPAAGDKTADRAWKAATV